MKLRVLLCLSLVVMVSARGQQSSQPQSKVIKSPVEYAAYMSAARNSDPQVKSQALELFLQRYPNTVVKEETLEQLMAAYQAMDNLAKTTDTACRILEVNPDNIRAIALLVYVKQAEAKKSADPVQAAQLRNDAIIFAKRGLKIITERPKSSENLVTDDPSPGLTAFFKDALAALTSQGSAQDSSQRPHKTETTPAPSH